LRIANGEGCLGQDSPAGGNLNRIASAHNAGQEASGTSARGGHEIGEREDFIQVHMVDANQRRAELVRRIEKPRVDRDKVNPAWSARAFLF
jgi:hypothetical protein